MAVRVSFVVSASVFAFVACRAPAEVEFTSEQDCVVERVADADTITVDCLDANVRLLLVDAPEVARGGEPAECWGEEAANYLRSRLPEGTVLRLQRGVRDRDDFGRYLRYAWLGDELLNETLVRQGWAVRFRAAEDTTYRDRIAAAEAEAEREGIGFWGACGD